MTIKTTPFDAADYLNDKEDIAAYLEVALEGGDLPTITQALGTIARARGMSDVARQAGVTREGLYKAFSETGDPKLSTLLGTLQALGLKLSVKSANRKEDAAA